MTSKRSNSGAILLEVVLALALFAAAAGVLSSALNSSMESVHRQKRELHAQNLAMSLLAEIQLGARSPEAREAFPLEEPFEEWTGEIVATPTETETGTSSSLLRIEVVVRHTESSTVYRLGQWIDISRATPPPAEDGAAPPPLTTPGDL